MMAGVALPQLWKQLYEHGIYSVLVEGGAQVAGAALASGTVDKVQFFVAPLLIGAGRSALEGWSVPDLGPRRACAMCGRSASATIP
jgi:diaminohydroxyphosphoribosylaminopyrimidine deaminase/5-amino-6-(5-phosphoribosylamino)uracil reductase